MISKIVIFCTTFILGIISSYCQIQYIEIDYANTSKSPEGNGEVLHFNTLKDNGKVSLYSPKDTVNFVKGDRIMTQSKKSKMPSGLYVDKIENSMIFYAPIFNKDYYIKEDSVLSMIKWVIVETNQKNILGYDCKMAKAHFRGRDYKVFYTEQLPFFSGPWKLSGLPGTILEAETEDTFFQFKAIKIKLSSKETLVDNPYKNLNVLFMNFAQHKQIFLQKLQDYEKKVRSEDKEEGSDFKINIFSIEK